jgi:hypothetical protein
MPVAETIDHGYGRFTDHGVMNIGETGEVAKISIDLDVEVAAVFAEIE